MKTDKLVDIDAVLRIERDLALLIWTGESAVWVPKSLVENNGDGTFTMPEWLAIEKELV